MKTETAVNCFVHQTNNEADVGSSFGKCTANFRAEPTVDFIVQPTRKQTERDGENSVKAVDLCACRLKISFRIATRQRTKFRNKV